MTTDAAVLRRYAGVRALVFGATGFIGGAVARALVAQDAHVTRVVRDREAAELLQAETGFDTGIVDCDVLDRARLHATLRLLRPHVTFNLTGYGVARAEQDAVPAQRINGEAPMHLCEAVSHVRDASWPGAALVHAGTQLEYGMAAGELTEETPPRPTTLYGRTKLAGTLALQRCAALSGIPVMTARIFTVYGPGEMEGRLLPSLIEATTTAASLPLTSGTQALDFIYIDDVAEGLLRLGAARVSGATVVNLGTGQLTSVRSFAEQAAYQLGLPAQRLQFGALPQRSETMCYGAVSTAKLRQLTGWTPPTTVADGIRRTMERYGLSHVED